MKTLLLDIESAPTIAGVWRLYDDYISTDQIMREGYVLCVSAKWLGEKGTYFYSEWTHGRKEMLERIHALMDEADVIIHYNGVKYDIPTLHREFVVSRMAPPSPSKHIDMLPIVRKQFKFISNKLDYVCQQLGLGKKVKHKGMQLWWDCMTGDKKAHAVMERYNRHDVLLLEKLYHRLLAWIPKHPNVSLYSNSCAHCGSKRLNSKGETGKGSKRFLCLDCGEYTKVLADGTASPTDKKGAATKGSDRPECCPRCESTSFQSRGYYHTATTSYLRFRCNKCGGFFHGTKTQSKRLEAKNI